MGRNHHYLIDSLNQMAESYSTKIKSIDDEDIKKGIIKLVNKKGNIMSKYETYNALKEKLINQINYDIEVGPYEEINYGIQFDITYEGKRSKIRIYESKKKGITLDLSQIKYDELKTLVYNINSSGTGSMMQKASKLETAYRSDQLEVPLIGVDESGKGDYFGPLIIAGVYADQNIKIELMKLGVADSKTLNDTKIHQIAKKIKELCSYEIITLNNETYNELYERIQNLNELLAWGHARTIENLVQKTGCQVALSDQFGNEKLIKDRLMEKSKNIVLEQRPRAEQNVVVAAASILARDAFVTKIKELEVQYNQSFPKGAGTSTIEAGKEFVSRYGKGRLKEVGKVHFKTTSVL